MKEPRLLVITDLGNFKAFKLDTTARGTPRLEVLEEQVLEQARGRVVEKVTDLAGRRAAPTSKDWGSPTADDHNLLLETKRRIVKQIAAHIKRIAETSSFTHLWLVAHKEIINLILEELPQNIRSRIELHLARDYSKAPKEKILKYFGELILETTGNRESEKVAVASK
ncbi:MAG: host attachment protein [Verrucomicrobiia bacterium]